MIADVALFDAGRLKAGGTVLMFATSRLVGFPVQKGPRWQPSHDPWARALPTKPRNGHTATPAVVDRVGTGVGHAGAAAARLRRRLPDGRAPVLDPVPVSVREQAARWR
jgi:hypothetical protein